MHLARKLFSAVNAYQPFTMRGFATAAICGLLLKYLAYDESDLVAAMIGGAGIGLVLLAFIAVVASGFRLKRQLRIAPYFQEGHNSSRKEIPAGLRLESAKVLPFLSLALDRQFPHGGAESPTHLVGGGPGTGFERIIVDNVSFPHRGAWELNAVRCRLADVFGLCALTWDIPVQAVCDVLAPLVSIRPLPIVAASSRPGDTLNLERERTGDPFDLKAYDPSDGIKRILWKTYAKSQQLVVRRPEPALIPEGEVAMYLVADREDDHVAGACLDYVRQLHEGNITVLFGTDGLSSASQNHEPIVSSPHEIIEATIISVWQKSVGSGSDFQEFLDKLIATNRRPVQIIVFAPSVEGAWHRRVVAAAERIGVHLVFALVPEAVLAQTVQSEERAMLRHRQKLTTRILAAETPARERFRTGLELGRLQLGMGKFKGRYQNDLQSFTTSLMHTGTEVVVCEGYAI